MIENNIRKVCQGTAKQQVQKIGTKGRDSCISTIPDKIFRRKYGNPVKLDKTIKGIYSCAFFSARETGHLAMPPP